MLIRGDAYITSGGMSYNFRSTIHSTFYLVLDDAYFPDATRVSEAQSKAAATKVLPVGDTGEVLRSREHR